MEVADGFAGQAAPMDGAHPANEMAFFVESLLAQTNTAALVKVLAVNAGDGAAVGTVDVQPMVHQVDGAGQVTPHGTVHGLPFLRLQAGTSAIILDPVAGDIGLAVFTSRDTSSVRATGTAGPPGSSRRFSMSDGVYVGGLLNAAPTQFVQLAPDGITITSPNPVTINAPAVHINGAVLTHNGVPVGSTHKHGGVQTGGGTSGVPVGT